MAFVHPYGIIGFASHIEFTGSLIFCQDVDLDVLDFQLFGVNSPFFSTKRQYEKENHSVNIIS
jgi:hypothetical protein